MPPLPPPDSAVEQRLSAYFDQLGTVLWDCRQRHCFASYAIGLMSELERKSLEPIAASLTDDPKTVERLHHRLQNFVADAQKRRSFCSLHRWRTQPRSTIHSGEGRYYSDTFLPLRDDLKAFERDPANRYTYCIRNFAPYECLNYGSDGSIRRRQHYRTVHGTGFAYQLDGEETRLLTNEHLVCWPAVTDA